MELNYKETAEDLRYQYNKFIELWKKAKECGLSISLEDTHDYKSFYMTKNRELVLHIHRTEQF